MFAAFGKIYINRDLQQHCNTSFSF